MRSSVVVFALTFAMLGLLLGYAASYDSPHVRSELLQLTTDKSEYEIGETVTFTAENLGSETLVFPDSALGIQIRNMDTGDIYSIIAAQVLTPIEGGQSVQVVWAHEQDLKVESGNYVATIHTVAGSEPSYTAEVRFRIN